MVISKVKQAIIGMQGLKFWAISKANEYSYTMADQLSILHLNKIKKETIGKKSNQLL